MEDGVSQQKRDKIAKEGREPTGSGRMEKAADLIIAKRQKEKAAVQRLAVLVGKRVKCTGCFNRNVQKPCNGKFTLTKKITSCFPPKKF